MNPNDITTPDPDNNFAQTSNLPKETTIQPPSNLGDAQTNTESIPQSISPTAPTPLGNVSGNSIAIPYEQSQPDQSAVIIPTTPIEKNKRKIGDIIAALIFIIGGLLAAYFYIYVPMMKDKVSVSDLQTKTYNVPKGGVMTYLAFKDWPYVEGMYNNKAAKDGQPTAVMYTTGNDLTYLGYKTFDDTAAQGFRDSLSKATHLRTVDRLKHLFVVLGANCDTDSIPTDIITVDASKTTLSWGISYEKITCKNSGTELIYNSHAILSKDGNMYVMAITTDKSNWDQNKETYQKILDSVKVTKLAKR